MDAGLDSGPILLKKPYPLTNTTTIGDVYTFLEKEIPGMFLEAINGVEAGTLYPAPQSPDPSQSLRCYPRTPRDGEIHWSLPARDIDALVRAASEPFAGAYTHLGTEKIIIWRSGYEDPPYPFHGTPGQVAHRDPTTGEVRVVTGEGLLILREIESTRTGERGRAAAIITTIRTRLGMDVTGEIIRLEERIQELERAIGSRE